MSTVITEAQNTTDLPLPVAFEGNEIRVFEEMGDIWIPITDIARAVGYSRQALHSAIIRSQAAFEGHTHLVNVNLTGEITPNPNPALTCVNEQGLYLLLGKMQITRIKNPVAAAAVVRFQRWVPELIRSYRKGDLLPVRAPLPTVNLLKHNLEIAAILCEYTGVSKAIGTAAAVAETERRTKEALSWCRELYPPSPDRERGHLNASAIGFRIGAKSREVNALLQEMGLQVNGPGGWRLTDAGMRYGEAFPFAKNGHSGYQILWRSSVVRKIEEHQFGRRQLQQPLVGGYLA